MPSNHTGDGTGGFVNIYPMLTDADPLRAQLWRVTFEQLANNLKFVVDNGVSNAGGTVDAGETLVVEGDLDIDGPSGRLRILSGADFGINSGGAGAVASGASFQLQAGSDFIVEAGADADWAADVDVQAGSVWTFASTAGQTFAGGSVITHQSVSGELHQSGAIDLYEDVDGIRIDSDGFTWALTLTPVFINEDTPGVPDWTPLRDGTFLCSEVTTPAGENMIAFAPAWLPGDQIINIVLRIDGGHGAGHGGVSPADMPIVQLVEVDSDGTVTVIASATDPQTGAAYDIPHSVTIAGGALPYTVPANRRVLVRVIGEAGANAVANTTRITWIDGTGLANHFRNTSEVY